MDVFSAGACIFLSPTVWGLMSTLSSVTSNTSGSNHSGKVLDVVLLPRFTFPCSVGVVVTSAGQAEPSLFTPLPFAHTWPGSEVLGGHQLPHL